MQDDAVTAVGDLLAAATRAGLGCGWVGAVAAEGEEGLVWCEGAGSLGGPATTPGLLYDLASLTKPLATATLLLLARRDGIGLDTRLGELLGELADSPWAAVTLEQCATHTAGFPAWAPLYAGGGEPRASYLEALARLEPEAPPGRRVLYSCPGYVALGLALERSAGAGFDELFAAMVSEPLELDGELCFSPPAGTAVAAGESAWFVEAALLAERGVAAAPPEALADAVSCDDGNARGLGGAAGNAGLFGTAAAAARLAAEYLPGGGELLTAEEAAAATRCATEGLDQARGLGWQLASTPGCSAGPSLPAAAFGHTGFTGTSVWVDPERRQVLVLLGNRLHPWGRTRDLHPLRRRFHTLAGGALPEERLVVTMAD